MVFCNNFNNAVQRITSTFLLKNSLQDLQLSHMFLNLFFQYDR